MRASLDANLLFSQIMESPDAYKGHRVMLGGVIVETRNYPDSTEIVVVQKELDSTGYPYSGNATGGRFIFSRKGYLESEIYSKGREVVGAGTILGSKTEKVGDREYRYPVIEAEELYLFEIIEPYPYYYYPPYWDPYFYPYWSPRYYYHRRHFRHYY